MILSIGIDGERTMTGRINGVQTLFKRAANYPVVRIWCGLHQVDLVTQREYEQLCDEIVILLTSMISYLRRQQNLQIKMKSTYPKFASTHWLSMKKVTGWLKRHRVKIIEYFNLKNPTCKPKPDWWIVLLCLDSVADLLSQTVTLKTN